MYCFSLPLEQGSDPLTRQAVFGFRIHGFFVFDLYVSRCGCFKVNPLETYGVTQEEADQLKALNELVHRATAAAVEHGFEAIREALGAPQRLIDAESEQVTSFVESISYGFLGYIQREYGEADMIKTPFESPRQGS